MIGKKSVTLLGLLAVTALLLTAGPAFGQVALRAPGANDAPSVGPMDPATGTTLVNTNRKILVVLEDSAVEAEDILTNASAVTANFYSDAAATTLAPGGAAVDLLPNTTVTTVNRDLAGFKEVAYYQIGVVFGMTWQTMTLRIQGDGVVAGGGDTFDLWIGSDGNTYANEAAAIAASAYHTISPTYYGPEILAAQKATPVGGLSTSIWLTWNVEVLFNLTAGDGVGNNPFLLTTAADANAFLFTAAYGGTAALDTAAGSLVDRRMTSFDGGTMGLGATQTSVQPAYNSGVPANNVTDVAGNLCNFAQSAVTIGTQSALVPTYAYLTDATAGAEKVTVKFNNLLTGAGANTDYTITQADGTAIVALAGSEVAAAVVLYAGPNGNTGVVAMFSLNAANFKFDTNGDLRDTAGTPADDTDDTIYPVGTGWALTVLGTTNGAGGPTDIWASNIGTADLQGSSRQSIKPTPITETLDYGSTGHINGVAVNFVLPVTVTSSGGASMKTKDGNALTLTTTSLAATSTVDYVFDYTDADWDNDGDNDAVDETWYTDNLSTGAPGVNAYKFAYDATTGTVAYTGVYDVDTDALVGPDDVAMAAVATDGASPILVKAYMPRWLTGDNVPGATTAYAQSAQEEDATPGDSGTNDRVVIYWSEPNVTVADATKASFDGVPYDVVTMLFDDTTNTATMTVHVLSNNGAVTTVKSNSKITILPAYGGDAAGNTVVTVTDEALLDGTSPYVPLNSSGDLECYFINPNSDGDYTNIYLKFSEAITNGSVVGDWTLSGVSGRTINSVSTVGTNGLLLGWSGSPITYVAGGVTLDYAYSGTGRITDSALNVVPVTGATPLAVNKVAGDDPNTNDIKIMDISGTVTAPDGNAAPPMTLVSGYVARLRAIEGEMEFQGATIELSAADLSAINSGIESGSYVYAHTFPVGGLVDITNVAARNGGAQSISEEDHIIELVLNVNTQARVVSFSGAASVPGVGYFSISGSADMDWVVGPRSQTAIDNDQGTFLLHIGDNADEVAGNPVLLQVSLPDGTEYMATNVIDGCGSGNGTSGTGQIVFEPLNDPPYGSEDGKMSYTIDLSKTVQSYTANQGVWNIIPVLKDRAYWVASSTYLPTLPMVSGTFPGVQVQATAVGDGFVAILPPAGPAVVGTPIVGLTLIDDLLVISNRGLEFSDMVNQGNTGVMHVVGGYGYAALLQAQAADPTLYFFGSDLTGATITLQHNASNLGWHTLANFNEDAWADMGKTFDYGIHYDIDNGGARSTDFSSTDGDLLKLGTSSDTTGIEAYFLHTDDNVGDTTDFN